MYYSYECWKNGEYITKGVVFATDKKEAIQTAFYNNGKRFEIKNVKQIK